MMDRMGIKERRGSVLRNCEQCGCEFSKKTEAKNLQSKVWSQT